MKAHGPIRPPAARTSRAHAPLALAACAAWAACAAPGSAEIDSAPAPAALGSPDAEAGRLAADVAWLAADEREGRRAGTRGEREAGEWIARRLAALGLEPAGEDGGWFQPFEVPLPPRDGGRSRIVVGGDIAFAGEEAVVPLFCSAGGGASGEPVFCGYGVLDEDLGWDDFPPPAEEGSIAVIVRGVPPFPPPADGSGEEAAAGGEDAEPSWGAAGSIRLGVRGARRRGYDGVVLVPHPDAGDELLAFDPSRSGDAGIPALMVSSRVASLALPGLEEAVRAYDAAGEPAARRERVAAGQEISLRADVHRERAIARNVLGRLPGEHADRTVVVGAHYDHLGTGGPGSLASGEGSAIHNGADDNASGTAVVLELARLLAREGPPEGDVLFALWSGEELGLLGSEHWAEHPTVPWENVVANLNLDMVGRAEGGAVQVLGAGSSPAFAAWMPEEGSRAGLELAVHAGDSGLGGSDHMTFLKREVPALFLFTGVHADYHKPTDDPERFEAEGARRVTELARGLVARMQSAGELAFVRPERSAPERRERGWSTWFGSVPAYSYDGPGVKLDGTQEGSPADRAGFLPGDVLVALGDVEIANIHDFVYALQVYKPGDVVLARYLRDGEEQEVRVTLGTREVQ